MKIAYGLILLVMVACEGEVKSSVSPEPVEIRGGESVQCQASMQVECVCVEIDND